MVVSLFWETYSLKKPTENEKLQKRRVLEVVKQNMSEPTRTSTYDLEFVGVTLILFPKA